MSKRRHNHESVASILMMYIDVAVWFYYKVIHGKITLGFSTKTKVKMSMSNAYSFSFPKFSQLSIFDFPVKQIQVVKNL